MGPAKTNRPAAPRSIAATLRALYRSATRSLGPATRARRALSALVDAQPVASDAAFTEAIAACQRACVDGRDPIAALLFASCDEGPSRELAGRARCALRQASDDLDPALRDAGLYAHAAFFATRASRRRDAVDALTVVHARYANAHTLTLRLAALVSGGELARALARDGARSEALARSRSTLEAAQHLLRGAPGYLVGDVLRGLDEATVPGLESEQLRLCTSIASGYAEQGALRSAARCWLHAASLARSVTPRLASSFRARAVKLAPGLDRALSPPSSASTFDAALVWLSALESEADLLTASAIASSDPALGPATRAALLCALWSALEAPEPLGVAVDSLAPLVARDAQAAARLAAPLAYFASNAHDPVRARTALTALARSSAPEAQRQLFLASVDGTTRAHALEAIQHAPPCAPLRAVRIDALEGPEADPGLRCALVHALARDTHPEAREAVEHARDHGTVETRAAARAALASLALERRAP